MTKVELDFSYERTPPDHDKFGRRYALIIKKGEEKQNYDSVHEFRAHEHEADLITSLCVDFDPETKENLHAPVIDFDIPVRYVPSTTPGHGHLYIDVSVSWLKYINLLRALAVCGFIEEGYYQAAVRRGYTAVRKPGVRKTQLRKDEEPF